MTLHPIPAHDLPLIHGGLKVLVNGELWTAHPYPAPWADVCAAERLGVLSRVIAAFGGDTPVYGTLDYPYRRDGSAELIPSSALHRCGPVYPAGWEPPSGDRALIIPIDAPKWVDYIRWYEYEPRWLAWIGWNQQTFTTEIEARSFAYDKGARR
jgi:hypothetical protein